MTDQSFQKSLLQAWEDFTFQVQESTIYVLRELGKIKVGHVKQVATVCYARDLKIFCTWIFFLNVCVLCMLPLSTMLYWNVSGLIFLRLWQDFKMNAEAEKENVVPGGWEILFKKLAHLSMLNF